MIGTGSRLTALAFSTLALLAASPAWAWHISGQVFCDVNQNQMIDMADTPIQGVCVHLTSVTNNQGSFSTTTGASGFLQSLPNSEDDWKVELTCGLPAGATILIPSSGGYGVGAVPAIHLQGNAFDATANFLVSGCVATPAPTVTPTGNATEIETPLPTATPTPTETPTATEITTPEATPTETATLTPAETATLTPAETSTPTETATPTQAVSTSTPTEVGTPTASPTPIGGDFQCYEVGRSTIAPMPGIGVVDRYGFGTVDLTTRQIVKRLCNPANVGDADPGAPGAADHLVGYGIKRRTPRFVAVPDQTAVTVFGNVDLTVVRPIALLVPSAKSTSGPPGAITPTIDHYQCYSLRSARGRASGVSVVDQFGSHVFDLKKPARLCVAADKNQEGVLDPDAALLCYAVRPASRASTFRGPVDPVFVDNQFGPDTLLVSHGRELCVAATVSGPQRSPRGRASTLTRPVDP